jgi:Fe-S cluster assembly iron-binding protein IscA
MMIVTDEAKHELRETLLTNTDDPEICLRLAMKSPSEFGLALDREVEGDQVIEHEGSKVLLIGREVAVFADSLTLDVKDTPEGKKLVFSMD